MKKGNTAVLVFLMLFMMFTGFVLGMMVIHVVDSKRESEKIEKLKQELDEKEKIIDESVHVYVPARKFEAGTILKNPYVQENFVIEDGFMAYYNENGEKISHVGVDLSYHNSEVNWEELAASPVEFVMLRCGYRGYTEGGIVEDERFKEYAQAANDNGLKLGVYFFSQAITEQEAITEAEYVLRLIEDYDISYPVAFDTEYVNDPEARTNLADLSREELTNICIAFCETIKEAGYHPMIYASENWFRRELDMTRLTDYDYWAPQYLDTNDFLYDFTIWQYTEKGNAPGVSGECDLDISLVDYSLFVPAMKEAHDTGGTISEYSETNPTITITPIDNNLPDDYEIEDNTGGN